MPNLIAGITPTLFYPFRIIPINRSSICIPIFPKIARLSSDKIYFPTISSIKSFIKFLFLLFIGLLQISYNNDQIISSTT